MPNFNAILTHILGIVFIIIVFALAYAYLKPHQLHKRRMVSTLLLKISYLLYLLVLLIIIYLSALVREGLETVFYGIEFFAPFVYFEMRINYRSCNHIKHKSFQILFLLSVNIQYVSPLLSEDLPIKASCKNYSTTTDF